MLTKAVLAATAMAVVAACGASADDDVGRRLNPGSDRRRRPRPRPPRQAVEGTLCSEVGVASEDPPPEDSEGFDGITIYIVEQPVDDTLVVDPGAGCAIRSTVSGDLVVNAGGRALALVNPGGVIKGDIRVSGLGRVAGLEDREGLSDELGPPTLEGDLLCDECSGVFAIPGTIEGSVDIVGTPTGGQTEFNGATIGGDVSIVGSSGAGQLDERMDRTVAGEQRRRRLGDAQRQLRPVTGAGRDDDRWRLVAARATLPNRSGPT